MKLLVWIILLISPMVAANNFFDKVVPGRQFSFPQDHNLHERFQTEWWYVTANLKGEDGFTYGAQFTLFSNTLLVAGKPQRIFFAHAALSTPDEYFYAERFAKANMAHGGIETNPWQVFLDNWQFKGTGSAPLPGTLTVSEPQFSYNLKLSKAIYFLQGDKGFSKKNSSGSDASYYYNAPFIKIDGDIRVGDKTIKISGDAWFDREWSSGIFAGRGLNTPDKKGPVDTIGWDWLAIHLDDETALMLYKVHSKNEVHLSGVLMFASGEQQQLSSKDINWKPTKYKSFNGGQYPIVWDLRIPIHKINIAISPINDNQFFNATIPYWEGAVKTAGSHNATGYLELFGY
jgi:predicted secreted hydrolase